MQKYRLGWNSGLNVIFGTETCSKSRVAGSGVRERSLHKIKEICFSRLASLFTGGFLGSDYTAISCITLIHNCDIKANVL